eukprot:1161299-Pelagomonas_calceolata.AAC.6
MDKRHLNRSLERLAPDLRRPSPWRPADQTSCLLALSFRYPLSAATFHEFLLSLFFNEQPHPAVSTNLQAHVQVGLSPTPYT